MKRTHNQITCGCGNVIESKKSHAWCLECGKKVFADPKAAFKDRLNHYYIYGAIVSVMTFLTYIFIEMIANPLI